MAVKHRKKLNMKMLKINNRVLNCRIAPITNQNKRKRTKMPKHKTKLRIKIPHKKKCRKFKDNWLCFNRIK